MATETRDRPHVAAAVAQVREQLAVWTARFDDRGRPGSANLVHAESAEHAAAQVDAIWTQERDLIRSIESQLVAGHTESRRLRSTSFGYGIQGHTVDVDAGLAAAAQAFAAQDLDRALWLTVESRRRAQEEERRCGREASLLAEAERARIAAIVAAEADRVRWQSSSSSSSSSSFDWSSSASSSSSSSSDWSSSSSSSDSSSSSSGGSGFGDSSSGGSSW